MKPKYWIITLAVLLVVSNAYWIYSMLDFGITHTYLEASNEKSEKMLAQTTRLANMELIGLNADEALQKIGLDEYGLEPFEKNGCINAAGVCVRLDENRVVIGIGE